MLVLSVIATGTWLPPFGLVRPHVSRSARVTASASSRVRRAASLISPARADTAPWTPSLRPSSSSRSPTASSRFAVCSANSSCFIAGSPPNRNAYSRKLLAHPLCEQSLGLLGVLATLVAHPTEEPG